MVKKLVITGSNGLLGQKLVKLFKGKVNYEIFALSRGENRLSDKKGYHYIDIDLLDKKILIETLSQISPDIIIHTAAMTNVDACELNPEDCDKMNIEVVANLIDYCRDRDIYVVHLSTDFIFDGNKAGLYTEDDPACPVNHYGLSKWKSEELLRSSGIKHSILRTILVYGMVDRNDRSNIVLWVKNSLELGKEINVVTDQLRMPTYAEDLAEACWLAVMNEAQGVFNVSCNSLMSIYDIAIAVAHEFGLDKNLIKPVETNALKLPAERPVSTGFDLNKSVNEINLPLYSFTERLQVFKDQLDSYNSL
ncbi:NAD(P)-dependent oxidoreductase [Lutimonas saemankumensis]|uniref:SDR family oxidoreductase n=1 Tax=Lutimonas saemankumensis TaxID=483016 RepID=UPI001CD66E0B|nr:NAD(P)-dependent oxidoreductase [Lutimonas saemankumensis]MCA0933937.1 NAD(P)-dependent oxidoreductase [Lutimonas saemankumensis]